MTTETSLLPKTDLARYLSVYPEEMAFGDEDPGTVLDRYHTPDFVHCNDGILLDRDRLIAHARPARKNATSVRVEVHEALVSGDRVAARYTLTATLRRGQVVVTEIYMFGQLAANGRLRRIDSVTRTPRDAQSMSARRA